MSERVEVIVGVVGRPHGIRGEVSLELRTDEPDRRLAVGAIVRPEGQSRPMTIASSRSHAGRWLVGFADVLDRTAAEELRGTRLVVDVEPEERPVEPEEFYDRQLVGLRVLHADGTAVGRVAAVLHLPAQDVLEVDTEDGQRLVPFVAALVPDVDLAAGTLRLADVPGLLDEDFS